MVKPSTADLKNELCKLILEHQQKVVDEHDNGEITDLTYLARSFPVGTYDLINQAIKNVWREYDENR